MWDPDGGAPLTSFAEAVPPPAHDPGDAPRVCIPLNTDWLPYLLGAAVQLVARTAWAGTTSEVDTATGQATDLLVLIAQAGACMQFAIRFADGCTFQQSTDGGTTWTTVPGWDTFYPDCITALIPPATRLVVSDGLFLPPITVQSDGGDDWIYHG